MSRMEDDGCVYLTSGEHYCAYGYVTIKVGVSFESNHEPDEAGFFEDLCRALDDNIMGEYDVESYDDLTIDIERDEE